MNGGCLHWRSTELIPDYDTWEASCNDKSCVRNSLCKETCNWHSGLLSSTCPCCHDDSETRLYLHNPLLYLPDTQSDVQPYTHGGFGIAPRWLPRKQKRRGHFIMGLALTCSTTTMIKLPLNCWRAIPGGSSTIRDAAGCCDLVSSS